MPREKIIVKINMFVVSKLKYVCRQAQKTGQKNKKSQHVLLE